MSRRKAERSFRLRILVRFGAVIMLAAVSGCLTRKPDPDALGAPVANTYSVPLTVESRFREDLTLYVMHDGLLSRLTRVGSATTSRVVIPPHLIGSLGEITLMVEGMGARSGMSGRFSSGRLRVLPGQGVVWTLETRLERSFAQLVPAETIQGDTLK